MHLWWTEHAWVHHASINNSACSAVCVPCTAPLTTATKPVHSASGSNSTYPTSGYNGTTWIHYGQMISKVGILRVYQKWWCTVSSPLMTSHRARMFWKVEQAKLTDMLREICCLAFLFCFERTLPSTLYCYGPLGLEDTSPRRRRLNSTEYRGGAWSSDVCLLVIDMTSDWRCTDVRRQDVALLGEAVPLTAHRGNSLSRYSSKQSSLGSAHAGHLFTAWVHSMTWSYLISIGWLVEL